MWSSVWQTVTNSDKGNRGLSSNINIKTPRGQCKWDFTHPNYRGFLLKPKPSLTPICLRWVLPCTETKVHIVICRKDQIPPLEWCTEDCPLPFYIFDFFSFCITYKMYLSVHEINSFFHLLISFFLFFLHSIVQHNLFSSYWCCSHLIYCLRCFFLFFFIQTDLPVYFDLFI